VIVISDTSPLNYRVLIQREHILPALFGRVLAPPGVIAELRHVDSPPAVLAWAAAPAAWLEVRAPSAPSILKLGRGEAEAISLAQEVRADAVLIDERKASAAARKLGLFVTGTMGVLEVAAEQGLIELPNAIADLRKTTFRCSEQLFEEVLKRDAERRRPR
jgi:predicted nucleic acid-binding protein